MFEKIGELFHHNKTAINGKRGLKLYFGEVYATGGDGKKMHPYDRVFRVGPLSLFRVVRTTKTPFEKDYYLPEIIDLLNEHYEVRWEKCVGDDEGHFWHAVYSQQDGGYIGTPEDAYRKYQRGLLFIYRGSPQDQVCSIGYNVNGGKWYGWSQRAMYGFGIGDRVEEGDCCASSGYTESETFMEPEIDHSLPVGFIAKTEEDCKLMAIAFANAVS